MSQHRILLVDDESTHRNMLRIHLKQWGYEVAEADDGESALAFVQKESFDLVLSDVRMARMDGLTALAEIRKIQPDLPVIIMTAWSSLESAVEALRLGAYDYIQKPIDLELLQMSLKRSLDHRHLSIENNQLREALNKEATSLIGHSPSMRELAQFIETVAPSEATVLISGESGTGKELVAQAIQSASHRADKAFVTVNCAALTESLLESELFGHEKGAFTGADKRREGRFKQADGGTLFLDEIGELPLSLQAKLLRTLQQGEIQRVGSDVAMTVDVRIITATNRDLQEEVRQGRFREDLFYRLNVIALKVPSLRDRAEDIPVLATHFLQQFNTANRKKIVAFTQDAMQALCNYSWPGNVRELQNAIERAVILSTSDTIIARVLPLAIVNPHKSTTLAQKEGLSKNSADYQKEYKGEIQHKTLEAIERNAILGTLKDVDNNKSEAARRLGITRATLHNKLRRYGLEAEE